MNLHISVFSVRSWFLFYKFHFSLLFLFTTYLMLWKCSILLFFRRGKIKGKSIWLNITKLIVKILLYAKIFSHYSMLFCVSREMSKMKYISFSLFLLCLTWLRRHCVFSHPFEFQICGKMLISIFVLASVFSPKYVSFLLCVHFHHFEFLRAIISGNFILGKTRPDNGRLTINQNQGQAIILEILQSFFWHFPLFFFYFSIFFVLTFIQFIELITLHFSTILFLLNYETISCVFYFASFNYFVSFSFWAIAYEQQFFFLSGV